METPDTSTPVVVLRCSRHGGLGITRSLGRLGVPVYHVDESSTAPAFYSRYSRGHFIWDAENADSAGTVAFFEGLAASIGRRAILIPTSDGTALLIAREAERLAQWFDFPRMEMGLVNSLCSKREMHFLAQKHGLATPETLFPQSREELVQHSENLLFPVMVKGIFGIELERKSGRRMFLIHSRRQLIEFYDRHEDWFQSNLMVQEFIPGGAQAYWMFNGYFDRNSDPMAEYTGVKIRQYPADLGLTSLGQCANNETVRALTRHFVKSAGCKGILDIDYIYDARDGQYKVLDVNPRIGATFRLFVGENGMDVAQAMYLDMTGQPVPPSMPAEGRKWLVEDCDLISSVRHLRDRKHTLGEWLRSYRGVAETGIFALDDPRPAVMMGFRHLQTLWDLAFRDRPLAADGPGHGIDRPMLEQGVGLEARPSGRTAC